VLGDTLNFVGLAGFSSSKTVNRNGKGSEILSEEDYIKVESTDKSSALKAKSR
jgi:hypothetical protein